MGRYRSDMRDICFNLFEDLKVHENSNGQSESELRDIIQQFDKFVENELFPTRTPSDEVGVKLNQGKVTVPECLKKVHQLYYENGWFTLGFPEEVGGTPVAESIAYLCASLATGANTAWYMYPGLTKAALNVILKKGTDAQKNMFVSKIMEGRWGGTMCLTEPSAGSDVGALRSTATPIGNGKYSIKGNKIFISSGDNDLYENIIHLVLARTPNAPQGSKGISLFIVPKFKTNADGSLGAHNNVTCNKIEHKMGLHAQATCELVFGQNGACEGELIGDEMDGMATMFIMMNEARLLCGIQGEAQANLSYQMAEAYARERVQFGTEIVNQPDVKRMLLKSRAIARGMRSLCLYTADLFDRVHAKPELEGLIGLLTPVCKAYCSEQGFSVAVESIQIHGGYGYCSEYGVEQFARDSKIATIYEGTNGIQAMDFVMRKILKDKGRAISLLAAEIEKDLKEGSKLGLNEELTLFQEALVQGQKILAKLGEKAAANQFNTVLQYSSDTLNYFSHVIVAWRLLKGALVAHSHLTQASGDEKKYYQSKVTDFQSFAHYALPAVTGIGRMMTKGNFEISSIEI